MNLKEKCHILRSQGKSYNAIIKETGVAKSTLSFWFKGTIPAESLISGSTAAAQQVAKDRILAYHAARKQSLKQIEFKAILEAQKDFKALQKHPLFMAGLMLYAKAGDTSSRHVISLSDSDPLLCLVFLRFIQKYLPHLYPAKVKLGIVAYENHSIPQIEAYWLKILAFEPANLRKTHIIKGRSASAKLPYGIGNVSISNRIAKVRLLELLRLGIKVLGQ